MQPSEYVIVGEFSNDTKHELRLFLEMTCEEVFLAPGLQIELLARPNPDLLPVHVAAIEGGLQIFPFRDFDPDWHIRFKGKVFKPGYPTRLTSAD
ncbi:hypothetical protein [Flavobacterium sp.]|jgi:hypothetical protein|uniref:hypothetical protein n=1 Tax=Flavobacterium sp. TaxID=239 RepID=UPI0037BF5095